MSNTMLMWNRGFQRTGNSLKVDAQYGPYYTLQSAQSVAASGSTIVVYPGTYTLAQDDQLLKNGVNWFFYAGALVTKTNVNLDNGSGNCYGIFDDRVSGAVTCRVDGAGDFYMDFGASSNNQGTGSQNQGNTNAKGTVTITNAGTDFRLRCAKVRVRSYLASVNTSGTFVSNCTLSQVDADEITDVGFGVTLDLGFNTFLGTNLLVNSVGIGAYWEFGESYTNAKHIKAGIYGIYGAQVATGATNWWVTAELIETTTGNSIYMNGDGTKSNTWRTWVTCKENRGGVAYYNQGKHYLLLDKTSTTASSAVIISAAAGGTMEVWLTAQKISATGGGNFVSMTGAAGSTTLYLTCPHYEDTGTALGISVGRGSCYVYGGRLALLNPNGAGVEVTSAGGSLWAKGMRIDTSATNSANNVPARLAAAATMVLDGCTLIAPALADSIKGDAARTVACYGVVANKDKNANITLSPNAGFTVDSAAV